MHSGVVAREASHLGFGRTPGRDNNEDEEIIDRSNVDLAETQKQVEALPVVDMNPVIQER